MTEKELQKIKVALELVQSENIDKELYDLAKVTLINFMNTQFSDSKIERLPLNPER